MKRTLPTSVGSVEETVKIHGTNRELGSRRNPWQASVDVPVVMNFPPTLTTKQQDGVVTGLDTSRPRGRGAMIQAAAHLYFIASGLWLTTRWMSRRALTKSPPDAIKERRGLQRRFSRYLMLLRQWNMLEVTFHGFEDCQHWRGNVLAPNHPSLMDAVALISRVPELDCVMNSKLLRDPVMGGAAKLCDYVCNSAPVRMLRSCQNRLTAGSNILIFPEATRTLTPPLGPFHQGFALAAIKAGAPIRTIFIECDSLYFGRNFSFFRPACCPMSFHLTAARVFPTSPDDNPRTLSAEIENYFSSQLMSDGHSIIRRTA